MMKRPAVLLFVMSVCTLLVVFGGGSSVQMQAVAAPPSDLAGQAQRVLDAHCISCHGPEKQKGSVRFDGLEAMAPVALQDIYLSMKEVIEFKQMPPPKSKQPSDAERQAVLDWLDTQMSEEATKPLEDKLRQRGYGNHVDHDKLFSGEYADLPGFTYDRRWLISQYIFKNKINRMVGSSAARKTYRGRQVQVGALPMRVPNMTNPFLLPAGSGVRDFANSSFDGGAVLTMLANSEQLVPRLIASKQFMPSYSELVALEVEHTATLERREAFLRKHIDQVAQEVFSEKHEALLPKYVPLELPVPEAGPDGKAAKLLAWDFVKPSHEEALAAYAGLRRYTDPGDSRAEVIDKCQRAWFNEGLDANTIRVRLKYVTAYAHELEQRYDKQFDSVFAYRPLAGEEMAIVAEALRQYRAPGDTYLQLIDKCVQQWDTEFRAQRVAAGPPSDELLSRVVSEMFVKVLEREPSLDESEAYLTLAHGYIEALGRRQAIAKLLQTMMLSSEFVYRNEFGIGNVDEHGRRMMLPRDAAYAIAYALTEDSPDTELMKAVNTGKLNTREDYRREVQRLLKQRDRYYLLETFGHRSAETHSITNIPIRKLRFFRDFFGYYDAHQIFKDNKRFGLSAYVNVKGRLIVETDMLIEHILKQDRDVFETLLTTDEFYVYHSGDNEAMQALSVQRKRIYDHFKDLDWQSFTAQDLIPHAEFLRENPLQWVSHDAVAQGKQDMRRFRDQMKTLESQASHGGSVVPPFHNTMGVARFFNIIPSKGSWDYPTQQPAKLPNRKGMLTHPAWLLAHATNTETDPTHRGLWIREKLLAGNVPDVPITVDAVLPEDPHASLRDRLDRVTKTNDACWRCHIHMNPLGLPFEIFDDFGRYRTEQALENPENLIEKTPDKGPVDIRDIYKTLPIDASGELVGTGDPQLDGEVKDAFDLIDRLAKSDRVRQSIIRHAFRFFMGRNETLSDSKALIDAEKAYLDSGGSFDALIVSLLTSDSFIYRKAKQAEQVIDTQR